jgi:hypothetical protein
MRAVFGGHLVAAAVLLALTAATASAQEDGVFIDPDSPAGTEYAIPLEQARREAAGGGSPTPGGGSPTPGRAAEGQPLFGAGIAPRGDRESGRPEARARGARAGAGGADGEEQTPRSDSGSDSNAGASTAAIAATAGDGSWDTLATAGIAAAVLALGLAAGLAFRRATKEP